MNNTIENRIENLLNSVNKQKEIKITPDTNLFTTKILDSFGIIEYITALEKEFAIQIPNEELIPQNFQNISSIANLVSKYQA